MNKITALVHTVLEIAASIKGVGINFVRIAIFIIFVWIGGLKFWNYEAEGIVPFVANSPFMSFFYTKDAPEYKDYKLKEGEFDKVKHEWHEANLYLLAWFGYCKDDFRYLDIIRYMVSESWFRWYGVSHLNDFRYSVVPYHNARSMGTRPW